MSGEIDPFREYHRARRRMTLARVVGITATSAALAVGLGLLVGLAPPPEPIAVVDSTGILTPTASPTAEPASVSLPEPVATAPLPEPVALPVTGPRSWSIDIDTMGYQAEIDQCLWVHMTLGATAPVVGAHNYCGGGDVLEMALGDTVTLTGTGLDGIYQVSDARDARAGDNAAQATAGMVAAVILQTCYWVNDGSERLVALTRIG